MARFCAYCAAETDATLCEECIGILERAHKYSRSYAVETARAAETIAGRGAGDIRERAIRIIDAACDTYGVSYRELVGPRRMARIVFARHMAAAAIRAATGMTFEDIGAHLGGRDHTTIMASCRKVAIACDVAPARKAELEALINNSIVAPTKAG